jgi:predicted membrane channel-forming protein YqfA (hemolysin III family)
MQLLRFLIIYIIVSPIFAWFILKLLFKLSEEMGITLKKGRTKQTWLYASLLVFVVGIMIHIFSAQCACPCPKPYQCQSQTAQNDSCLGGSCCR